jgi:hypothetical protein
VLQKDGEEQWDRSVTNGEVLRTVKEGISYILVQIKKLTGLVRTCLLTELKIDGRTYVTGRRGKKMSAATGCP